MDREKMRKKERGELRELILTLQQIADSAFAKCKAPIGRLGKVGREMFEAGFQAGIDVSVNRLSEWLEKK